MKNSDRFLASFNTIEKMLKRYSNHDRYVPFQRLVDLSGKSNAVIRKYRDDLKEFADLRNAIVHERTNPHYVIAEPHDSIVVQIESIERELASPLKVIPFFQREVKSFRSDDSIADVLKTIQAYAYSQFPIYENGIFKGVLSENGITYWLAKKVLEDIISFSETTIGEVLSYQEDLNNYKFADKNTSIYEVQEIFQLPVYRDIPKLDAVLITEHGKPDEALLGIITVWDITAYGQAYEQLGSK